MKLERSGIGIAKGMTVTLKHLLARKPITTQYPEERLTFSRRFRGYGLVWVPQRCTGCVSCAKSCPQGEIKIVTSRQLEENEYEVEKFEIDIGHCKFCGLCVEACPFDALFMTRSFERANYRRRDLVQPKEKLIMSEENQPSGYFRPRVEALLPEQTLLVYRDGKES